MLMLLLQVLFRIFLVKLRFYVIPCDRLVFFAVVVEDSVENRLSLLDFDVDFGHEVLDHGVLGGVDDDEEGGEDMGVRGRRS